MRSPLEFETFSDDELEEMSRDVLLADVANLEGAKQSFAWFSFPSF